VGGAKKKNGGSTAEAILTNENALMAALGPAYASLCKYFEYIVYQNDAEAGQAPAGPEDGRYLADIMRHHGIADAALGELETWAKKVINNVFPPDIAQSITGCETLTTGSAKGVAGVPAQLGPCPISGEPLQKDKAYSLTFTGRGQGTAPKTFYVHRDAWELVRLLHGACFARGYCVGKLQHVLVAMDAARLASGQGGALPRVPWPARFMAMTILVAPPPQATGEAGAKKAKTVSQDLNVQAPNPETGVRPPVAKLHKWTNRDIDTVRAAMSLLAYSVLAWYDTVNAIQQ